MITFQKNQNDTAHISIKDISKKPIHLQRLENISLPKKKGDTEFCIGKISKDICFTRSRCLFHTDYHACIHYPKPTTLLIFGLKGYSTFSFSANDPQYTIRPGDVWLIQTNQQELLRTTPAKQENEMLVIRYDSQRLKDVLQDEQAQHTTLSSSHIMRLGHQVKADHGATNLLNNNLETASDRLIAESESLMLLARWMTPQETTEQSQEDAINMVVKRLTADMANTPSLQRLATEAQMSHTKLNRCFKKRYGTTVYSWLRNYRLERARHYLESTDNSVTDIAFQCGFSSASHLAQAFKQQYNHSPVEHRKGTPSSQ